MAKISLLTPKYRPWFQIVVQIVFGITYRIVYRLKIVGNENIPKEGCIVCSNHPTANDPFMLLVAIGMKFKISSMGKIELFQKNKPLEWFLVSMGAFPVDREKNDVGAIKKSFKDIKEGKKLIMFPEGTRTKHADGKAKGGIGLISAKMQCPVVPIYITENQKIFGKVEMIIGECLYPPVNGTKEENTQFSQDILDRIFEIGKTR